MESSIREHMYKISPSVKQTACLDVNSAAPDMLMCKLSLDRLKINIEFLTNRYDFFSVIEPSPDPFSSKLVLWLLLVTFLGLL